MTSMLPIQMPIAPISNLYAHREGIGGWLILIAFSLGVTPFAVIQSVLQLDIPYLAHSVNFGSTLLWSLYLLKHVLIFLALLFLNWLFYSERRTFPRAMIAYYIAMVVLGILECFIAFASLHETTFRTTFVLIIRILSAAVWIPYFVVSRRVKATFINE